MRLFALLILSFSLGLAVFSGAYAAESVFLSDQAFDFSQKYNPGYEPKARQEFDRWLQELSALLPVKRGFLAQILAWEPFLYVDKGLKCGT